MRLLGSLHHCRVAPPSRPLTDHCSPGAPYTVPLPPPASAGFLVLNAGCLRRRHELPPLHGNRRPCRLRYWLLLLQFQWSICDSKSGKFQLRCNAAATEITAKLKWMTISAKLKWMTKLDFSICWSCRWICWPRRKIPVKQKHQLPTATWKKFQC